MLIRQGSPACSRRSFLLTGAAAATARLAPAAQLYGTERRVTELSFASGKNYSDPFNELELDVVFTGPQGKPMRVPAFWAGDQTWSVRFAPPSPGRYTYKTVCSDASNADLHGKTGTLEAEPYRGENQLYRRGALRVSANKRYLEHADGTPFLWLGDTWWMGLTKRLRWPEDFQALTADRVQKGFSVVQIVAGLFPDMDSFDPRGTNEAGFAWQKDYARINPAFWDMADLRMQHLVERGLTPCILGCWGYYLPKTGMRRMKQHWRYIVARWGAYPVVWCLAGELSMAWYLTTRREQEEAALKTDWTEVARYLKGIDPYGRLITAHPTRTARASLDDPSVLDFNMLQTGHSDRKSIANTISTIVRERAAEPVMPVVNGEVNYEGIFEASREEVQRFMFWTNFLCGATGYTYGANGIWQVNTKDEPYGPSPHGRTWGNTPWDVAAAYPGSRQIGLGAALLKKYEWWRFEPHPEWVEPHWSEKEYQTPYAAGIPGSVHFVYVPAGTTAQKVTGLEGSGYSAAAYEATTMKRFELGSVAPAAGAWTVPILPTMGDWVLVIERK